LLRNRISAEEQESIKQGIAEADNGKLTSPSIIKKNYEKFT